MNANEMSHNNNRKRYLRNRVKVILDSNKESMSSTLIIYDSKYGCTKTYAKLIAEKVQAEIQSMDVALDTSIAQSETIIFWTYVRVGQFHGAKWIKEQREKIKNKKIIFYSTSAEATQGELQAIFHKTFSSEQIQRIKYFWLPGMSDYSKLTLMDKILMRFPIMQLKKKAKKGDEKAAETAKKLKSVMGQIHPESIQPILDIAQQ